MPHPKYLFSEPYSSFVPRNLPSLPHELVDNICNYLDANDVCALRRTCKALNDKSEYAFGTAFLGALRVVVCTRDLKALIAISKHPHLSQYVRICCVAVDMVTPALARNVYRASPRLWAPGPYWDLLLQQCAMNGQGVDFRALATAFANFKNLEVVQSHLPRQWGVNRSLYPVPFEYTPFDVPPDVTGFPIGDFDVSYCLRDIGFDLPVYPAYQVVLNAIEMSGKQDLVIEMDIAMREQLRLHANNERDVRFTNSYFLHGAHIPFRHYAASESRDGKAGPANPLWLKYAKNNLRRFAIKFWEEHPLSHGYVEVIKDVMSSESLQSLEISNGYPEHTGIVQGFSNFQHLDWPTHLTQLTLRGLRFPGNVLTKVLKGNAATLRTLVFQDIILEEVEDSWVPVLQQMRQMPLTSLTLGQLIQFVPYSAIEPTWGYNDHERQQLSAKGEAEVATTLATTLASFQAVAYEVSGWRERNWPQGGGFGTRYHFAPSQLPQHLLHIFFAIDLLRSYWTPTCGVLVRFPVVEGAEVMDVEDRMED
ncbi:hypothetical protein BU16DRAFT_544538 [Lophium mytilinum]|uniref:F-box domain-containing protein n=1 Tax=Lophium mytilinum TaxID=390894 RepID=A0A6A6QBV4_9PEZI|nr:hypothetical protein BU16DRAFT_544538 [Lophium mytilinum]